MDSDCIDSKDTKMTQKQYRTKKKYIKKLLKAGNTEKAAEEQVKVDAYLDSIKSKKSKDVPPVETKTTETPPAVETAKDESTSESSEEVETKEPCKGKPCKGIKPPSNESTSCDTDSQEEKNTGKIATEAEARKAENSTEERENESSEDISSVPDNSEDTSTSEGSNPTGATDKDSSEAPTTDKVEPPVEEKSKFPWGTAEVPSFVEDFVNRGWLGSHGTVTLESGASFELHANRGFDEHGRTIEIPYVEVHRPNTNKLDDEARKKALQEYDKSIAEARLRRANELLELYKRFGKMMPSLKKHHLKTVHCWNKHKEKALGLTGTFVGLQGGVSKYTILIDGTGHDGKPKKIKRGYRFMSTKLPDGVTVTPTAPLKNASDVEKVVDKKLITDKRSGKLVYPAGYDVAVKNLTLEKEHHTILVWNQNGQQMSFFASPVFNDEDEQDGFKWLSFDFKEGNYITISNNVIAMKGSVQELLRVTIKVNQQYVDNMLVISIPKSDSAQLAALMAILDTGTVVKGKDSEGKKQ